MRTGSWKDLQVVAVLCAGMLIGLPAAGGSIASPSAVSIADLEPAVVAFVSDCDRRVVEQGRPLTKYEADLASKVGVLHPERVRILVSDRFPEPDDSALAERIRGLGPAHPLAETTGYGIQLTTRAEHERRILLHELTHVGQFERLGVARLMHAYLEELTSTGYDGSELEAQAKANEDL